VARSPRIAALPPTSRRDDSAAPSVAEAAGAIPSEIARAVRAARCSASRRGVVGRAQQAVGRAGLERAQPDADVARADDRDHGRPRPRDQRSGELRVHDDHVARGLAEPAARRVGGRHRGDRETATIEQ
jgi:hypothetical protein